MLRQQGVDGVNASAADTRHVPPPDTVWVPPAFPPGGIGPLRAIHEATVPPGRGLPLEACRELELLTFVLDGTLEQMDSLGDDIIMGPGDVHRLTAGSGVLQLYSNASERDAVHFLQLRFVPDERALAPCCHMRHYAETERRGGLCRVASSDGSEGTLALHADVNVHMSLLEPEHLIDIALPGERMAWLQVLRGEAVVNGRLLAVGQGACVHGGHGLLLETPTGAEILMADFPHR
jgi:quercetin 2,3-dioxygenase